MSAPPESAPGRARRFVGRLLGSFEGREGRVLLAALTLAATGYGLAAVRVSVDPRLTALLPEDTPTQDAVAEAAQRLPGTSPLYIAIQSSDPALNRQLATEAREQIAGWEDTLSAITRRDPSFFLDHRLLYLDAEVTRGLAGELREYVRWKRCEAVPGCINFLDEPPRPDFDAAQRALADDPKVSTLLHFFGADELPNAGEQNAGGSQGTDRLGDLCSADGTLCVVQAIMRGNVSNFAYAEDVHGRATAVLAAIRPPDGPSDLRMGITGRIESLVSSKASVAADLGKTAALSGLLVLLVLVLQYRSARALVILLVPLAIGMGWTALACALLTPTLNVVSAATLAVLMGLGIDFGLHLTTHYGSLRDEGVSVRAAVRSSVLDLFPSLVVAGFTTSAGFAALMVSDFRGFMQMGALAASGVLLTLLAYLLLFGSLTRLLDRVRTERSTLTRRWRTPAFYGRPWSMPWAGIVAALGVLAIVGGAIAAPAVGFEDDYGSLRPRTEGGLSHGAALHGTASSPLLIMADDEEALTRVGNALLEEHPDGIYGAEGPWLLMPSLFLPDDQPNRLAAIAELASVVEDARRHLDDEARARVERWSPMLAVTEPVDGGDLPEWVRRSLGEPDGTVGAIAVAHIPLSGMNAGDMERLAGDIDQWRERFPEVRFASNGALLGEVTRQLRADSPAILGLALLGLLLATALVARSFRATALVLAPVVVATALLLLAMLALGIQVHLYNLIVFPVGFGMGVDGAIYVVWATRRRGVEGFAELPVVGRAVLASTLTTMGAFGSLMISSNPGLASLGQLAVIALSATLVATLLWLPALLSLTSRRKASTATTEREEPQ